MPRQRFDAEKFSQSCQVEAGIGRSSGLGRIVLCQNRLGALHLESVVVDAQPHPGNGDC